MSDSMTGSANTDFSHLGNYAEAEVGSAIKCVLPSVLALAGSIVPGMRVLDVGCGLGALAAEFTRRGCTVVGIDLDEDNLAVARRAYPSVRFVMAAANEHVLESIEEKPFDLVTCTEVVEHVYSPKSLLSGCFKAIHPGGRCIVSAPYHGYFKNLMIALSGKSDGHYNPLWEGGHIKFFSRRSMSQLLYETGFLDIQFKGAGRAPWLWMSQVMSGVRPV